MPPIQWSDAWLLYALVQAQGSFGKANRIADYTNHAVPTEAEWNHAKAVFQGLGLTVLTAEGPELTPLAYTAGNAVSNPLDAIDQIYAKLTHLAETSEGR